MTDDRKRENIERTPDPEEKTNEGVVNDSLGTVDPADATGLDESKLTDQKSDGPSSED
jgi:hypothetical protein